MGKFSELDAQLKSLSTGELVVYYERLHESRKLSTTESLYKELYAREIERREQEEEVYSPYWGA
jgi:hypothetical protein